MKLLTFITMALFLGNGNLFAAFTLVTEGDIVNDGGWNYGCAWGDYDNDGFIDLFVVNNEASDNNNFLYHNNGDGTFTRITEGAIVTDGGSSYGCTWGDYNNDGFLDLFVSNYNENNFLYTNNGDGTFTRVTEGTIVNDGGSSAGCSWGDYDNDGFLDLFVANRTQTNFLYHNNGDGTFTKITTGPVVTDYANSSGGVWGDYDGDNYPDLFVPNAGPATNFLYHNNGDGTFTAVTEGPVVTDEAHSNSGSWGDYDNDEDLDLFVASGVVGQSYNYLYRNNGDGTFSSVTGDPIVEVFHWAGGSSWGDFDHDGDLDLFVGGYDGDNLLYTNDGFGAFTLVDTGVVVTEGSYSMGSIWGDYDNDGDLDLFVAKNNYFSGNNTLFRNEGDTNSWLKVRGVGTISNTSGIGAKVLVYATINGAPVRQLREISGQTGGANSGQNSMNAMFGLGDATIVDSMRVVWPSGTIWDTTNVAVNQFLVVTEGPISGPSPDIQANGSDGPLTVPRGDTLTVTVSLDPGSQEGEPADWWAAAASPFGLYWYTLTSGWVNSNTPIRAYAGPLFYLPPHTILDMSTLPVGGYTFYFCVDDNMDGVLDATYLDSVLVDIQ